MGPVSLVPYSDSESGADSEPEAEQMLQVSATDNQPKRKRKADDDALPAATADLPPLPAAFLDLYATAARVSTRDDPSLHGGRKRSTPHVEGNWPTHVYLEWHPTPAESATLAALIDCVQNYMLRSSSPADGETYRVHSLLQSDLAVPLPLHISLSRSLVIRTTQRDAFLESLTACIRHLALRPFSVTYRSLKWVPNFERTRWFLVLRVVKPKKDELNLLLRASNEACAVLGLPKLYGRDEGLKEEAATPPKKKASRPRREPLGGEEAPPSALKDSSDCFHVSLAWTLLPPREEWDALAEDDALTKILSEDVGRLTTEFETVKVKIGNAINNISLATKAERRGGGILG